MVNSRLRQGSRLLGRWLVCALAAGILVTPWAVERAIERASFEDRLGTLPVRVGLAHNGYSTVDTGVFGKIYWTRTGAWGFGASVRSTGPPLADGTVASYVSPEFVKANTQFLDDPSQVAAVYGDELRQQVTVNTLQLALIGGALGGCVLVTGWTLIASRPRRTRWLIGTVAIAVGAATSTLLTLVEFRSWDGNDRVTQAYALPGHSDLSFSSPQTREIAQQIQPFIERNTRRIRENASRYAARAQASLREALESQAETLVPRDGEVVIIAEADPQGSVVGTRVRTDLYASLEEALPEGAIALRTIAGDITSNGTVAEADFVDTEAQATPDIPTVAAKGDHDTDVTVDQLLGADVTVPDSEIVDEGGVRVASARDPAFKALFGGLVVNESGLTEADVGERLREEVDSATEDGDSGVDVVLHQPRAVEGYLGMDLDEVQAAATSLTTPVNDGIPDIPPGIITHGHLHDPDGPWVVWNDDGDQITWTVITQLGTAGGVEENPTFNRFSTPFSVPLKALSTQLQYVNPDTGLQTGLVPIAFDTAGDVTIGDRIDVGLPGGIPGSAG